MKILSIIAYLTVLDVIYACTSPSGWLDNISAIDFQDSIFGHLIPSGILDFEAPIQLRATSSVDTSSFVCMATFSENILHPLTKERPILSEFINEIEYTTSNRVWCSAYGYATVWYFLSGKLSLSPLFALHGLMNDTDFLSIYNEVFSCGDDMGCIHNIGISNNYCPDIMGVIIGHEIAKYLENDGFNQFGSSTPFGECTGNCRAYSDPLGLYDDRVKYKPFIVGNKGAFTWANLLEDDGVGFFYKQEHVTPHIGYIGKPRILSRNEINSRTAPKPKYIYKDEVELVIDRLSYTSENDTLKARIELFDNKIAVVFGVIKNLDNILSWSWEERQLWIIGVEYSEFDTVLLAWKEKVRYNLIRPTTLIKSGKYGKYFNTYGGPNKGLQNIRYSDFEAYIRVMPHAEYPSGSGCICRAIYEVTDIILENYYDISNSIPTVFAFPSPIQPFSKVEPSLGQNGPILFNFDNMEQVYQACGQSRLDGGMHFTASISGSEALCKDIGDSALIFMDEILNGAVIKDLNTQN